MEQKELQEIIERHQHYLAQDCEGWEKMKADLRRADLRRADLSDADLSDADLSCANLSCADLRRANLRRANLSGAVLRRADLRRADLSGADLSDADLSDADLSCANLSGADLRRANLRRADLSDADLRGTNLSCADLSSANLRGANLRGVIYDCNTAFFNLACPEDGDFIGWKKTKGYIIKLRIPADAKRSSATTRKCRCSHAEVLEIQNIDGSKADTDSVTNDSYVKTTYTVGKTVHADEWDADRWNECSHGIHFFITRDEAVMY